MIVIAAALMMQAATAPPAHASPPGSAPTPQTAARPQTFGEVKVRCTVEVDGHMDECAILSESPAGQGFGAATLKMANKLRMKSPAMRDGVPVRGVVIIPVRWQLDSSPPPTGTQGPSVNASSSEGR